MLDAAVIESINHDQVVTRTDRLLLRARVQGDGAASRRSFDFTREAQAALAASRARTEAQRARAAAAEDTLHMRPITSSPLLGAGAVAVALTWLATTVVCLLV